MKINWTVRFKNKTWVTAFVMFVLSTVYTFLDMFGVVPEFDHQQAVEVAKNILGLLSLLGIIVDPTTAGLGDSKRALAYEEPWKDPENG